MTLPNESTQLGQLIPDLEGRSGGPDPRDMNSLYANTIGSQLPPTWDAVAEMTIGELLRMDGVGRSKVEAFLSDLESDVGRDDSGESVSSLVGHLVPGLRFRQGGPDPSAMDSSYANTLGANLPRTWGEVADLRVADLLDLRGVGRSKVDGFLDDLRSAQPDSMEEVIKQLDPIVRQVIRSAVEKGLGNMTEALSSAIQDPAIEPVLSGTVLPSMSPADWLAAADMILDDLEEDAFRILDRRVLSMDRRTRATLQELADESGVTRERIRQKEQQIIQRVEAMINVSADLEFGHARRFFTDLGPAIPMVASPIGSRSPSERLVLWSAGPFRIVDGWLLSTRWDSVNDLADEAFAHASEAGLATPEQFLTALRDLGVTERFVDSVASSVAYERVGLYLLKPARSMAERAVLRLRATGRPMTIEELLESESPDQSKASFSTAVQGADEIVRTGKTRYELVEWGGREYPGIVTAMVDRITEVGAAIDVSELAEQLADQYEVSATSVRMYATMHPKFVTESEKVRLRTAAEPYTTKQTLEEDQSCLFIDGQWLIEIEVDSDLLRGSGRTIPEPFAVHLGLQPLDSTYLQSPHGQIAAGWGMSPWIGSIRAVVESLGAAKGESIQLRRVAPGTIDFRKKAQGKRTEA